MNLWTTVGVALQSLTANRLRSALTMLGIAIGVLAVILCTAVGSGARQQVLGQIEALGSNSIIVMPGQERRGAVSLGIGSKPSLKLKDVAAIRKSCPHVVAVIAQLQRAAQVKYDGQNTSTTIVCSEPDLLSVQKFRIETGRFITERDEQGSRKVCVLGKTTARTLFGDSKPIGRLVRIKGIAFKIVGLMALKGSAMFGNPDDQVYIPVTTGMRTVFGLDYITQITAQASSSDSSQQALNEIDATLRREHRLAPGVAADYTLASQAELLKSVGTIAQLMTLLLAGIASIALFVGGIGIMNIMIVSVTERTREIGIRKAVGAKKRDILVQFLVEAMTVSVLGGILGIVTGVGLATLIAALLKWSPIVSPLWISISFFSSLFIGVFFGIYPAYQAAQMDPIEALRHQ